MTPSLMEVTDVLISAIRVGPRRRAVDDTVVRDIAQSIERQGLLQPIGVRLLTDEEAKSIDTKDGVVSLVFGAHRLAAYIVLQRETIEARILPSDLTEEEYLLIELQENSARNDLTGAQRKAYAGEIGKLIIKLSEDSHVIIDNEMWWREMIKTTGVPQPTLYRWWQGFCEATERAITPRQALDRDREAFFSWLQAQQVAEAQEKERKEAEAAAARQRQDLDDGLANLYTLASDYGRATVITEVIEVFLAHEEA